MIIPLVRTQQPFHDRQQRVVSQMVDSPCTMTFLYKNLASYLCKPSAHPSAAVNLQSTPRIHCKFHSEEFAIHSASPPPHSTLRPSRPSRSAIDPMQGMSSHPSSGSCGITSVNLFLFLGANLCRTQAIKDYIFSFFVLSPFLRAPCSTGNQNVALAQKNFRTASNRHQCDTQCPNNDAFF